MQKQFGHSHFERLVDNARQRRQPWRHASPILDDPVQHIDDYRALHLTEVLTAIRATNRQVVCTVEDESLGKLLARRLRTDSTSGGLVVRMAYSSRDGIHIA